MINLYTIATSAPALAEKLNLPLKCAFQPAYQARPGMELPVILLRDGKPQIEPARWGCVPGKATTTLQVFPISKVFSQKPMNRWIHTQRCLIPANCFFARHHDTGRTCLIRSLNTRLFLMGGIYTMHASKDRGTSCQFIVLTTESADVLRPLTNIMPVILSLTEIQQWLYSEHLIDLMQYADGSGDQWFDYFEVSNSILTPGRNSRDLLKPLGLSREEVESRNQRLKAVDLRQDRYDRKGSKR